MRKILLKIKHKKLLEELESIHINEKALYQYKFDIRNNKDETWETLEKKLKRNFMLGERVGDYKIKYGNLNIYHTGNVITNIINNKGHHRGFNIDEKLKKNLNILLGIE